MTYMSKESTRDQSKRVKKDGYVNIPQKKVDMVQCVRLWYDGVSNHDRMPSQDNSWRDKGGD